MNYIDIILMSKIKLSHFCESFILLTKNLLFAKIQPDQTNLIIFYLVEYSNGRTIL